MGFRFVVLGALLAMASAFSPTTPARSVVPSSRVSTPIVMAGWKDPYMDKFTGKKEVQPPHKRVCSHTRADRSLGTCEA